MRSSISGVADSTVTQEELAKERKRLEKKLLKTFPDAIIEGALITRRTDGKFEIEVYFEREVKYGVIE